MLKFWKEMSQDNEDDFRVIRGCVRVCVEEKVSEKRFTPILGRKVIKC